MGVGSVFSVRGLGGSKKVTMSPSMDMLWLGISGFGARSMLSLGDWSKKAVL